MGGPGTGVLESVETREDVCYSGRLMKFFNILSSG